jgi:hypothetical protein
MSFERMRLNPANHRRTALTIWEVLIVLAVVAALAAIFWYRNYQKSAQTCRRIACVSNLKNIGFGFHTWAIDFDNEFPMQRSVTNGGTREAIAAYQHFQVISNELNLPQYLVCPSDRGRAAATNFTIDFNNTRLSFFVNRDANGTNFNDFLAGDRNLTINGKLAGPGQLTVTTHDTLGWTGTHHVNQGNVLMSDGSVVSYSKAYIDTHFKTTTTPTNRLLFP